MYVTETPHSDSNQLVNATVTETVPFSGAEWHNTSTTRFQNIDIVGSNRYMAVTAVAGVSFLTIWGNSSVILCMLKSRRLSATIYSIYIFSLAFADLMVGVVTIPAMASYTYYGYWPLGNVPCIVWSISDYCCCTISVWHLSAISYDRERAVREPLNYRASFTKSRARKVSAILWILAFALWMPSITVFSIFDEINGTLVVDVCSFMPEKYFRVISLMIVFYLPIAFMGVEYVRLVLCLRKRDVNLMGNQVSRGPATRVSTNSETTANSASANGQLQNGQELDKATASNTKRDIDPCRLAHRSTASVDESDKVISQNTRAIRTLGVMIVLFFLCWIPWCLLWLIEAFCTACISTEAYTISVWLTYGNSCVNPYLYFLFNADFRSTLAQLYSCRCRG